MNVNSIIENQCFFELKEIPYDRKILTDIFQNIKHYARPKGAPWYDKSKIDLSKIKSSLIYYGDHLNLDDSKKCLSFNLLEIDYIKNLVNRLNLDDEVHPAQIEISWFKSNASLVPHIDSYAKSSVMWPIFPEISLDPIDFYYNENINLEYYINKKQVINFSKFIGSNNLICSHIYSVNVPTVINNHFIHGVRPLKHERIMLRLRVEEPFQNLLHKYKNGKLIKSSL